MITRSDLALNGGEPVRTRPWLDNFTTGVEEKRAAADVIDSGYLSLFEGSHAPDPPFSFWGGPRVRRLEEEWCDFYGVRHAVSMNSATSGLYAAIGALGLGYGDEIIVSPYTMSACGAAALVYGAIPVFADVQLETGSLDPASIEASITPRTRAILVVHQFGIPAEMDEILRIAQRHSLRVVEDCAQAHGAKYKGRFVGTFGDIGVFSLNVNKAIQTGEGGVCTTNDEDLRYRLALIRNHGEAVVGPAGYEDITNMVGFNYRPTEVQAAIASEQLKKLPDLTRRRLELVRYLHDELGRYGSILPLPGPWHTDGYCNGTDGCFPTYYTYPVRYVDPRVSRSELVNALNAEGLVMYEGYVEPLYLQPVYQRRHAFKHGYPWAAPENRSSKPSYSLGTCPNAEKLHSEELILNEHVRPPHTMSDMEDIATAFHKVCSSIGNG